MYCIREKILHNKFTKDAVKHVHLSIKVKIQGIRLMSLEHLKIVEDDG